MSVTNVADMDIALRPNQMRKGIREVRRRTRGNTYMAAGELMGFSNIKVDAIFSTVEEAAEFIAENYAEVPNAVHH